MKFARFSEDFNHIIVNRVMPASWRYVLSNSDCCFVFSPTLESVLTGRNAQATGVQKDYNLFVRDETTGEYWSVIKKSSHIPYDSFQYRFNPSYILIEAAYQGLSVKTIVFIPRQGITLSALVTITNTGEKEKRLKLFPFVTWDPPVAGSTAHIMADYNEAFYSQETGSILAFQRPNPTSPGKHVAYLFSSLACNGFDCCRRRVAGTAADPNDLIPVRLGRTSGSMVCGGDMVGVLMNEITLAPKDELSLTVLAGLVTGDNQLPLFGGRDPLEYAKQQVKDVLTQMGRPEMLFTELKRVVSAGDSFYVRQRFSFPIREIEAYVNLWLKKQLIFGVEWSREFLAPEKWLARQVLNLQGYLYLSSAEDFQPFIQELFCEADRAGFFTGRSVAAVSFQLQFAHLLSRYASLFRDFDFLKKKHPWCRGVSLLHYVGRMLQYLVKSAGQHGLVSVTVDEREDSLACEHVPLTIALFGCLQTYVTLSEVIGEQKMVLRLRDSVDKVRESLETAGKSSEHFVYSFHEAGFSLGSGRGSSGEFFLVPQVLAVLAGLVDQDAARNLAKRIERKLRTSYGYMSMVPAFPSYAPDTFGWSALPPGTGLNGGIVIEENILKLKFDCRLGDTGAAMQTLRMLLPISPYRFMNQEKGVVEPYFLPESIVSLQHPCNEGKAESGWLGGDAGVLYAAVIENIIGLQPGPEGLAVKPCFDPGWNSIRFSSALEGKSFTVCVGTDSLRSCNDSEMWVDGTLHQGEHVPVSYESDVTIEVRYPKGEDNE